MRIVSWKNFLITIIVGGVFLVWKIAHFDGVVDFFILLIVSYAILEGFILSFSKEACEEDEKKKQYRKQLLHKLFGRFAMFILFTPFLLSVLAILSIAYLPDSTDTMVLYVVLLMLSIGLAIGLRAFISKHDKYGEDDKKEI